ncbi:ferritin-like domain-containing protein [Streptomyces sp. S1A]|uniref:ferritin-like domain-containing protein n=1 Tax=Streptomyces TaxID=1883 RepID=UPI001EDB55BD|nr:MULTISPECIES: ferritin-like domain-containing protein [Streptomyces]MCG3040733.1 ferritin-like domain-containing protein [Streptomyces sp. ICN903]MDH2412172.1 ferritin-like domain-containing protein [Streptomyces chitinivorans]
MNQAANPATNPAASPATATAASPGSPASPSPGGKDDAALTALQAALSAEHAAVYGYGVVGGRIAEDRRAQARQAHDAHRARRDALRRAVRRMGGTPEPAAAAYSLPFPVPDGAAAVRLAAELEERVAAVYADLVRAGEDGLRREAAAALREAAVRAARWRGTGVPFPGLAERAAPAGPESL